MLPGFELPLRALLDKVDQALADEGSRWDDMVDALFGDEEAINTILAELGAVRN